MFGIWGHKKETEITYNGLHSMQHRGQIGEGIVVNIGEDLKVHKDMCLVNDVYISVYFEDFTGTWAVGHVRNATQDTGVINNVQPLSFHSLESSTAIAHNGNIMNADKLRR